VKKTTGERFRKSCEDSNSPLKGFFTRSAEYLKDGGQTALFKDPVRTVL
jgi:hypothetical protein